MCPFYLEHTCSAVYPSFTAGYTKQVTVATSWMHALRQNCGSFLYDSIRREWPLPEEEGRGDRGSKARGGPAGAMDEEQSAELPPPNSSSSSNGGGSSEAGQLGEGLLEWPIFVTPNLTRLRVTGFESRDGQTVGSNLLV